MKKKISSVQGLRLTIHFPSDETLIQQIRSDFPEVAFRQLLAKYDSKQTLQRYFFRRTGSLHETQDFCQEVFFVLFKNVREGKFTPRQEGYLARYLLGIARNQWLRECRNRHRQGWYIRSFDPNALHIADRADVSAVEQAESIDLEGMLVACLQQQSERSRRLLIGHYVEGHSYKALAKELGYASPFVAKQRCSVKRITLKQEIRKRLSA